MAELMEGRVEYQQSNLGNNTQRALSLSGLGSLRVAQGDPRYFELSRAGRIFGMSMTVAVAVASVQTVPTTTASVCIFNAAADGGKCIVPLKLGFFNGSGTSDKGQILLATATSTKLATALTANGTGYVIGGLRSGDTSSVAFGDSAKTVAPCVWTAVGGMETTADAVPGCGQMFDVEGLFTIKPGYALGLAVLSGAGTNAKFCFNAIWAEITVDMSPA
jgi:hypothetical protein